MTLRDKLDRIDELSCYLYINDTNTQVAEFYDVYNELCGLLVGNPEDYTGDIVTIDREMIITYNDGSRWEPEGDWRAFHEYIGLMDNKAFKKAFNKHLDEYYSPGNYPIKDVLSGPMSVPQPAPVPKPVQSNSFSYIPLSNHHRTIQENWKGIKSEYHQKKFEGVKLGKKEITRGWSFEHALNQLSHFLVDGHHPEIKRYHSDCAIELFDGVILKPVKSSWWLRYISGSKMDKIIVEYINSDGNPMAKVIKNIDDYDKPIDWGKQYFSKKDGYPGEVVSFEQANKMWGVMSVERAEAMGFEDLFPGIAKLNFKGEEYFAENKDLWKQYCHEQGIEFEEYW